MKKALLGIFIALTVLIAAVAIYTTVDNRILRNTVEHYNTEIFVPSGMADEYDDLLAMTFDDHRIWKYKLNSKEALKMTEELKKSCWLELSGNEKDEAKFYLPDGKWYEDFSEEVYYCLYDTVDKEFVSFGERVLPRFLFVYDSVNQEYYCVSVAV